jgi:hypothetical protein
MQGMQVRSVQINPTGIDGDRKWALIDVESGHVMSAKRTAALLFAHASDSSVTLADGVQVAFDAEDVDAVLSRWLDREVTLRSAETSDQLVYEMTFDPPDDTAEAFEIPVPPGTFLDLGPVHLVTTATLDGCARGRPDLEWDVRRFRPNLLLDVSGPPFVEDAWAGRRVQLGTVVLEISQPTVRCALPLRAQPPVDPDGVGLPRQAELFKALESLNTEHPNHLGVYADVVVAGEVSVGDVVQLDDP